MGYFIVALILLVLLLIYLLRDRKKYNDFLNKVLEEPTEVEEQFTAIKNKASKINKS